MRGSLLRRAVKRVLDAAGASALLLLTAPVMAVTAGAVAVDLGRPVFFRQTRPGRNGKAFTMIKFRTMRDAVDRSGRPLPDHERLTALGRFLRASSLDELPELINVVRGEMSLVGPRPLLTQYLPLYSPEQARRHDVKPGITGWAQIHGRNRLSWEEKFSLDVWYVDNWSIRLDLLILARTVKAVIRRDGISHEGEATMPPFTGTTRASCATAS